MVQGAQAPRELAENELKLSLSTGKENARNSTGKCLILVVLGAMAPRELAENELELSLSMREEMQGLTCENQDSGGPGGHGTARIGRK